MKRGFTVLELLVASLLLSMLVTMLTMIFNQSSIAWTSGLISVKALSQERAGLGTYHDVEDDLLPGVAEPTAKTGDSDNRQLQYRTVSLWKKGQVNMLRQNERAFDLVNWGLANTRITSISQVRNATVVSSADAAGASGAKGQNTGGGGASAGGVIVGVWSAGPNGKWGDEDDINTFPEEID